MPTIGLSTPLSDSRGHRFQHEAMATVFEAIIANEEPTYARQAARAAFGVIDCMERLFTRFDPGSELSQVNRLAAGDTARVGFYLYDCLRTAARLRRETNGTFDVTVGPLVRLWRTARSEGRRPTREEIDAALALTGGDRLTLDEGARDDGVKEFMVTVGAGGVLDAPPTQDDGETAGSTGSTDHPSSAEPAPAGSQTGAVEIDLGGIGKGYALDRAAELLEDWQIESGLLHGGGSTVLILGAPPGETGWRLGVGGAHLDAEHPWATVRLAAGALSGSGAEFQGGHILDPRTGLPVGDRRSAWALAPSAALADALSTAFVVMAPEEVQAFCESHEGIAALVVEEHATPGGEPGVHRFGTWPD